METRNGIGNQEDKEDLGRSGENSLGQEGLVRCGCRHMLSGGQKVKKKNETFRVHWILNGHHKSVVLRFAYFTAEHDLQDSIQYTDLRRKKWPIHIIRRKKLSGLSETDCSKESMIF